MILAMKMILMSMTISMLMMMMCSMISKKTKMDREKTTPFECGFDPKSSPRMPFSMHFFLIAIIFLIFDVEITIIIPSIYMMQKSNILLNYMTMTTFMTILLIGLYHEWKQGALQWSK